jgi:hypothetical protein
LSLLKLGSRARPLGSYTDSKKPSIRNAVEAVALSKHQAPNPAACSQITHV